LERGRKNFRKGNEGGKKKLVVGSIYDKRGKWTLVERKTTSIYQ